MSGIIGRARGIARGSCHCSSSSSTQLHQQQQRRTFLSHESRNAAIRALFQHLESNYGNLPSLIDTGPNAETIVAEDGIIHPHHLSRLFQHKATALHVPQFYHPKSAKRLGEELIKESHRGGGGNWKVSTSRGLESSDVGTLGEHPPYNVAVSRDQNKENGKSAIDEYFAGVQREFQSRRRRQCSAVTKDNNDLDYYQLWPLDKLRLELEEAWPSGAGLARETQKNDNQHSYPRPFGGGLPRVMRGPTRWKRGFIHVDELGPLDATRGLFSANIYLTVPDESEDREKVENRIMEGASRSNWRRDSGALYVWPLGVRSRWDWYRVRRLLSSLFECYSYCRDDFCH